MLTDHFSYLTFWEHPLDTLCYFSFAMSFLSLWIKKNGWIFGSFAFISVGLALHTGILSWIGLIPLIVLAICHLSLKKNRFAPFCIATAISCALIFHFLPGFHNWELLSKFKISPDSMPYSLWLNFDSPWVGFLPLALSIPLLNSRQALLKMLKTGLPLSIIGILIFMLISLSTGQVRWDVKVPLFFFVWAIKNLVFVSIPEEGFFRGFIQREMYLYWFKDSKWAGTMSVLTTSLLFTLLHIHWIRDISFLALVFLAGIIFGTIYQITQSIEASILCHFGLNLTHFLLFSYPILT